MYKYSSTSSWVVINTCTSAIASSPSFLRVSRLALMLARATSNVMVEPVTAAALIREQNPIAPRISATMHAVVEMPALVYTPDRAYTWQLTRNHVNNYSIREKANVKKLVLGTKLPNQM